MRGARTASRLVPVLLVLLGCAAPRASAASVVATDPFWFRDGYRSATWVDAGRTTAVVDTAGRGTVLLPYAPMQLALAPGAGRALVATQRGVEAALWDGTSVVAVPSWGLAGLPARGATWLLGGGAFAVSTGHEVAVYGLDGAGAIARVAAGEVPGIGVLAPGPAAVPSAILGQTAAGATLLAPDARGVLRALPGGPEGLQGNLGVAAAPGGGVAATWQAGGVQLWAWDGSAYRRTPAWDAPAPPAAAGPVVGVAFFPEGGGFWVLTRQGQLLAYAYGPWGLAALPAWSASLPAAPYPPAGLASGWGPGSVAVLYPWGWTYLDPGTGGALAPDPARNLDDQRFAAFLPSAVLQGLPIPASHAVAALRVEDADCSPQLPGVGCTDLPDLPPGTALEYAVGAEGCSAATPVTTFQVVPVAPGSDVCYRVTLSTADPAESPRLDVTNLFEIAAETRPAEAAALLCVAATC